MTFRWTRARNDPEDPPQLGFRSFVCDIMLVGRGQIWNTAALAVGSVCQWAAGWLDPTASELYLQCPDRPRALPSISHFAVQSKFPVFIV